MADPDVFERRLRAALVRHTGGGRTDFDALGFARMVAAKEPRRHGLGAILGWRVVAVPRVAWVLLLAALLIAMVAGMLVVGSQPTRKLPAVVPSFPLAFACPPGTNPDNPGPVDQARPATAADMTLAAFDRGAGKLVLRTQGRYVEGVDTTFETWTFDVCTNTWMQMHPAREPGSWSSMLLVYDVDSDLTIAQAEGRVWAYDLEADTWTPLGQRRSSWPWFYDPASGLVVASDFHTPMGLWTYDVDTDTWTATRQANLPDIEEGDWRFSALDASVDRMIVYVETVGGFETWQFDLRTGTWSRSTTVTPAVALNPLLAYDEAAERTVVFGAGPLAAYDATADRWEVLSEQGVTTTGWRFLGYDSVNARFIGLNLDVDATPADLLAFDPLTMQRTVLLEPVVGQPEP
jgi:hypothetical protein